jgi:hypothetical protein
MSDTYHDALRTLRRNPLGVADDGEATRARIQQSLRRAAAARTWRLRVLGALAATFLVGSVALAFFVTAAPTPRAQRSSHSGVAAAPAAVTPGEAPAPQPIPAASTPSASLEPPAPRPRARLSQPSAPAKPSAPRPAAPASAPPSQAERDALYLTAHRLHFRGAPREALAAWDAYLATQPAGPLAIEARYNRAVVLVRLGQKEAARAALQPFARGAYGGFRAADAQRLLSQLWP